MQFVDEATLEVRGGDGGKGCVAFRREKYRPLGGPSGGDGGNGGSVVLEVDPGLGTLLDLRYRKNLAAAKGEHGRGKDQYGKAGADIVVRVPAGTEVFDADSGERLVDMTEPGERHVIAQGGKGGRGNIHFATPFDRGPRHAEPGTPGQRRRLRFELKVLADVGLVGFPNVGKSTFIAAVSRARPKIADYPFTTLTPNLGVVSLGDDRSFVVADIPGIIEGAAEGAGLGLRFLKHVERTRVLLHLVTVDPDPDRSPVADFDKLMGELRRFDAELSKRPMIVAVSKTDLPEAEEAIETLRAHVAPLDLPLVTFSSVTRDGLDETLLQLERMLGDPPE